MQKHIYSSDRAVDLTLSMIQGRIDNPQVGISQHIPGASDFLMPWYMGELIAIVGYTSNGKSSFAKYMVSQHAQTLRSYQATHLDYPHIIVYVTWEQTIEEETVLDLSRVTSVPIGKIFKGNLDKSEIEKIWTKGAADRRSLPILLIGSSSEDDRNRERFTMEDIRDALILIEAQGVQIDLIVLDYLQRIRRRPGIRELREGYMDVVDQAKDMALRCPVILISQAGRQVHQRTGNQLPGLDDGQETSNLEQSSDHYYSVWMPKQAGLKELVRMEEKMKYKVDENLIMVGFLKQKHGPAPITRLFHMGLGGSYLELAQGTALTDEEIKRFSKRGKNGSV